MPQHVLVSSLSHDWNSFYDQTLHQSVIKCVFSSVITGLLLDNCVLNACKLVLTFCIIWIYEVEIPMFKLMLQFCLCRYSAEDMISFINDKTGLSKGIKAEPSFAEALTSKTFDGLVRAASLFLLASLSCSLLFSSLLMCSSLVSLFLLFHISIYIQYCTLVNKL